MKKEVEPKRIRKETPRASLLKKVRKWPETNRGALQAETDVDAYLTFAIDALRAGDDKKGLAHVIKAKTIFKDQWFKYSRGITEYSLCHAIVVKELIKMGNKKLKVITDRLDEAAANRKAAGCQER